MAKHYTLTEHLGHRSSNAATVFNGTATQPVEVPLIDGVVTIPSPLLVDGAATQITVLYEVYRAD